jgi:uncharacterized protein DUF5677
MTPIQLIKESLALLTRVLDEAFGHGPESDLRRAFIYRHARNVLDLGQDVLALELQNRSSASRIIVRPMIESLYRLAAAVKRPTFAAEKLVAELEQELERIQKWIAVAQSNDFESEMADTTTLLTAYAQRLRREHSVTTKNRWDQFATAKAAELDWHYARDYFLYSKYVHATISGIISQEYQIGRGHVLQTAIFVILSAVGHAVQGIETEAPQDHVDEAARLARLAINLTREGAFRDDEAA